MSKTPIKTDQAPAAIGPYSQAINIDGFLYCSGQIPLNPTDGTLVDGNINEQTHQVMKNLMAVLEAAGANSAKVVKTTIFLKDMNDFAAVNEVYGSYFQEPYPARACVEVARLPKDVAVEVEAIAKI